MSQPLRRPLDLTGFWLLLGLSFLFGANNLLIKMGNDGLQPVFFAAMRSCVAAAALAGWMFWRRIPFRPELWKPGLLIGAAFATEFYFLFIALDHTTVVRASIIFYAMPLWLAAAAHFLFEGERLTPKRALGFLLGFAAVALVMLGQMGGSAAGGSLLGDLAALFAGMCWASIIVIARLTRLQYSPPETQLFWQLLISAPILLILAPSYGGELVRDFDLFQLGIFLFHTLGAVTAGFVLWFWLLLRYPASTVASFSFVTPVLSALLGWLVLNEAVSALTPIALALLVGGLILINRRQKP
ncbi:MAG: putative permease, DMT superfamily [Rhodobacteraceae bacterium HLUCCA12]|nr:MAG: putative permease, DMT superfamily [Rhodobacteraceae bacterium HLUCCA12]